MGRTVRCQGAILHEHRLLLIQHREHATGHGFWLLPGGRQEGDETEEACVRREMHEATGLDVDVVRLLLLETDIPGRDDRPQHTYLCQVAGGEAAPGYEPEAQAAQEYAIAAVAWLDLRAPSTWQPQVLADPITLAQLQRIQVVLGYPAAAASE